MSFNLKKLLQEQREREWRWTFYKLRWMIYDLYDFAEEKMFKNPTADNEHYVRELWQIVDQEKPKTIKDVQEACKTFRFYLDEFKKTNWFKRFVKKL